MPPFRWIGLTLLMLLCCSLPGLAADSWTEDRAVRAFVAESPRLALLRRRTAEARAELLAAGLWANPTLAAEREQVFVPGGSEDERSVTLQLPIPLGSGLRRLMAREALAAAEAQVEHDVRGHVLDFRAAYGRARLAQAQVETLAAARTVYQRLERIVQERARAGESAGYDLMRLRLAKASLEARLAAARSDEQAARAEVSSLLGRPVVGPLRLDDPLASPPPLERLRELASGRRDLAALEGELAQARLARQLAGRLAWPDPQIGVGLKQTLAPTAQGLDYLASLSWPLPVFDRGQGEVARQEAEIARLEGEVALVRQRLEVELPVAREAAMGRLATAQAFERDAVERLPELLRVAEIAYQEGDSGLIPLLDAHSAAVETRLQHLTLLADARTSLVALERLIAPPLPGRN